MPSADSTLQTTLSLPENLQALVNINAVLQRALSVLSSDVRSDLVLRCDELPQVQGNEEELQTVFTKLLQLITQKNVSASKLYLHINCEKEEAPNELALPKGYSLFQIRFQTNITSCQEWMHANKEVLDNIMTLLPAGGNLQVNQSKNTGCLFCLTLPGK